MSDLISREAVRDLMYQTQCLLDEYDLDSIPSVDAVPVVHGYWKLNRNCSAKSYYCSVCLEGESDYGTENYCPNCGAKMDETN